VKNYKFGDMFRLTEPSSGQNHSTVRTQWDPILFTKLY